MSTAGKAERFQVPPTRVRGPGGQLRPHPGRLRWTVRQAAAVGLCGCTIEDTTANPGDPVYDFDGAVTRVRAAAAAAREAPHSFVLTARPVNVLSGPSLGLLPVAALAGAGVRRVSAGGALARVACGGLMEAGHLLRQGGMQGALRGGPPLIRP